jgi:hypothetical protein
MKRFLGVILAAGVAFGSGGAGRADDKDVQAVLDKAIKAMGGAEKLGAVKAATWKTKGTITFGGADNPFESTTTAQGLDHVRTVIDGEFGGSKIEVVNVLAGDKGWRKFGDMGSELNKDDLANEKRALYLQIVPVTIVPLKGKGFKVEAAGAEKVGGKPAAVLKVTGPDGKDFKLFFDEASGLPVKQVAKVAGFTGEDVLQETTYDGYKDFNGIKKATKTASTRDGEKFLDLEVTEFKPLDKVDAKTFAEPK